MSIPQVRGFVDQWARGSAQQQATTAKVSFIAPAANPAVTPAPTPAVGAGFGPGYGASGYVAGPSPTTAGEVIVAGLKITNITAGPVTYTVTRVNLASVALDLETAVSLAANTSVKLGNGINDPYTTLQPGEILQIQAGANTSLNFQATTFQERDDFGR